MIFQQNKPRIDHFSFRAFLIKIYYHKVGCIELRQPFMQFHKKKILFDASFVVNIYIVMKNQERFKANFFKILIPIVIVWGIITIARGGYHTGQWLYDLLH